MNLDVITQNANYFFIAAAVLAGLALILLFTRRTRAKVKSRAGQRIGVIEYVEIDQTRRMVLVRRDNAEHLLLIGGAADLVVETAIKTSSAHEQAPRDAEPSLRQPMPPVFGDTEPILHPPLAALRRRDFR